MKCSIIYKEKLDSTLEFALSKIDINLRTSIIDFLKRYHYKAINEIRIHKNASLMLIADSKNVITDIFVDEKAIESTLELLCDGSIYAHIDTIKHGYISVGMGIRAGICGRASLENGQICGIRDVTSINIRIPQHINNASQYVFSLLKDEGFKKSIIIYSAPGVGKTTILRDLAYKLSHVFPPIRHAIIDTKEEITPCISSEIRADTFISYPKGMAIELATKSMTPEFIICDEISSMDEASSILSAVNSGVKLIATAHASCFEELMSKNILSGLFAGGVFDYAVLVERDYGEKQYKFTLSSLKWSLLDVFWLQ